MQVLAAWPPEWRDRFFRFVTGAARPCLPQMEVLRLAMPIVAGSPEQADAALARLPQVGTPITTITAKPSQHGHVQWLTHTV